MEYASVRTICGIFGPKNERSQKSDNTAEEKKNRKHTSEKYQIHVELNVLKMELLHSEDQTVDFFYEWM